MYILYMIPVAVSLALDALAVAVSSGLSVRGFRFRHALMLGIYFGAFQFMMPLLGWLLGSTVSRYVDAVSPYIAFVLLGFIGGKMIWEAVRGEEDSALMTLSHGKVCILAIATSIDALAVGVTFALDPGAYALVKMGILEVLVSCAVIGVVAFTLSIAGGLLGGKLGEKFQKYASIAGGVVLIGIGLKTLISSFL